MASSTWLPDHLNLDEEIHRLREQSGPSGHADSSNGGDRSTYKAALDRIQRILEWDPVTQDGGACEELLAQVVGKYLTLVASLAASPSSEMPVTPPVQTLTRSTRLHKELLLLTTVDSASSEEKQQAGELADEVLASSRALAHTYARHVTATMVVPFWCACLSGTRGFAWHINGDSLALCTLVGLCRMTLTPTRNTSSSEATPPNGIGISWEVASLLVRALLLTTATAFVGVTKQVAEAKVEHITNALQEAIGLVALSRRFVPLLVSSRTYEVEMRPVLEQLLAHLGATDAAREENSRITDPFTNPVDPYREEMLTDPCVRDVTFLAK